MKKFLFVIVAALLAGSTCAQTTFIIGELKYTVTDETNHYVSVGPVSSDIGTELIIPSSVTYPETDGITYTVTCIGDNAFRKCGKLTSVTIPNSVTSIGNFAFVNCDRLYSVTIPESVTSIGSSAFNGCNKLLSITIPNSVTSIGECAFRKCGKLTSVTIPNSVTSIGSSAFEECSDLAEINVESNNTAYTSENGVLFNKEKDSLICCPAGKGGTYTIPNSVTSIGDYAFGICNGLTSIIIPNSITSIGTDAFFGCAFLQYNEYNNAYYLGNTDNPYLCLIKAKSANITDCEIYNNCKIIYSYSFSGCNSLTSVTIPSSVTSIGDNALCGCRCLTSINVEDENTNYMSDESGVLFNKAKSKLICYPAGNLRTQYTIPNSVTNIGDYAFFNCSKLNSVTIPNYVASIGRDAFYGCTGFTSITIPESVTSIKSGAFENCNIATLYCQAESEPSGWDLMWNPNELPVNWNCKVIKLTVNNPENGSAEVSGYAVKTADGSMWYLYNAQAIFNATPNNGYHVQWEDGNTDNNHAIAITENKTYTATFETHTPVDVAKLEATCTTNGHEAGKCCSVCNAVLEGMDVIPALNHVFGTPAYVWSEDGSSCTATVVCQRDASHVVTENASISSAVTVAATCEEEGTTTYTATFENELFATQTKAVDISPLNHRYGTPKYVWSEDGSLCTATAVCQHNANHVVTESATITNEVTIPATCDKGGTTTYTATFLNSLFAMQTKDVDDIPANGHTEVVEEAVAPTCTDMGRTEGRYCSVCGIILVEQKDIAPLNHNYGEPSYEWSEDGSRCTATAVCQRDASHVMTEDATIFISGTTTATCESEGSTTYMAKFINNKLFEIQTKTIADVPALGHNYLLPIYAWSANGSSCTAMAICMRDASHTITEKATITSEVTIAATCEGMGATTHTASFENEVFESQTKVVVDIPAQGHTTVVDDAVEPTCESFGLTEGSHCSVCGHVFKAQNILPALPHTEVVDEAVEPTCTIAGKTEGKHCAVCGTVLQAQERIPALGHIVDIDLAVPATCTVTGKTDGRHCSVCNTVIVAQKEVPALGHEFVNYVYNNDATTTADGTETAKCEHGCGVTDTRTAAGTKLAETPEVGTAVAESVANAVNIYAHHNIIVVENAEGEIIVYNAMGGIVYKCIARQASTTINISISGVYIVKVGANTQKVIIR